MSDTTTKTKLTVARVTKRRKKKRVPTATVTKETIHDSLYKLLFSFAIIMENLLRYFIPHDMLGPLNYATLERCAESFINRNRRERRNDRIWRVQSIDQEWRYICVLTEFQSTNDQWMAVRIGEYVMGFLHDLIRSGEIKPGDKLPPILVIVIHNGERKWTAPLSLGDLQYQLPAPLSEYQPQQKYLLIDIGRLAQELIDASPCILSRFFALERVRTPEELLEKFHDAVTLLAGEHLQEIRRIFSQWIQSVGMKRVGLEGQQLPEIMQLEELGGMLETTIRKWQEDYKKEGRKEGVDQTRKEIARNLAEMQMGEEQISRATGLSQEDVRSVIAEAVRV